MGSNSRYDCARPVGDREAAEARALHLIGELVGNYPGISSRNVAGQVAHVLHALAIAAAWTGPGCPSTNG